MIQMIHFFFGSTSSTQRWVKTSQVASLGTAWDAKLLGSQTPTADGAAAALTTLACISIGSSKVILTPRSKPAMQHCLLDSCRRHYYLLLIHLFLG